MSRTRNVRARQLRRWLIRHETTGRRNGVDEDGYDPNGLAYVLPWSVEAYLESQGVLSPRMSSRRYRRSEWRMVTGARLRNT